MEVIIGFLFGVLITSSVLIPVMRSETKRALRNQAFLADLDRAMKATAEYYRQNQAKENN